MTKTLLFIQLAMGVLAARETSADIVEAAIATAPALPQDNANVQLKENFFFGHHKGKKEHHHEREREGCCFSLPCLCGKPECKPHGERPRHHHKGRPLADHGEDDCDDEDVWEGEEFPTYIPAHYPKVTPSTVVETITRTHTETATTTSLHVNTSLAVYTTTVTSQHLSTQTFVLHPEATHTFTRTESYIVYPGVTFTAPALTWTEPEETVAPCEETGRHGKYWGHGPHQHHW